MARKNSEYEALAGFVVLMVVVAIYQAFLQIKLFYEQHQIFFFVISGLLITG